MSVVQANFTDSRLLKIGRVSGTELGGQNAELWFRATGQRCGIYVNTFGNPNYIWYSLDDGATWTQNATGETSGGSPTNLWNNIGGSGATETHNVRIRIGTGFSLAGPVFSTATAEAEDTSPSISANTLAGPLRLVNDAAFTTHGFHSFPGDVSVTDPSYFGYASPPMLWYRKSSSSHSSVSTCVARHRMSWSSGAKLMAWIKQPGVYPIMIVANSDGSGGVSYGAATAYPGVYVSGIDGIGFYVWDLPFTATDAEVTVSGFTALDAIMIAGGDFVDSPVTPRKQYLLCGTGYTSGESTLSPPAMSFSAATLEAMVDFHNISGNSKGIDVFNGEISTDWSLGATAFDGVAIESGRDIDTTQYATYIATFLSLVTGLGSGIKALMVGLSSDWAGASSTNAAGAAAVASWQGSNPSLASLVAFYSPFNPGDWLQGDPLDLGAEQTVIGTGQLYGRHACVINFSGLPTDGDVIAITSVGGNLRSFKFTHGSAGAGFVGVGIGADAATTAYNLHLAIVSEWKNGWDIRPVFYTNFDDTTVCFSQAQTVTLSGGANQTKYGPYTTGWTDAVLDFLPNGPTVASATTDGSNLTLTLTGTGPFSFTGGATTATGSLFAEHSFAGVHCTGSNATISSSAITCPLAVPIGQGQTVPSIDSTNLHGLHDAAAAVIPAFSSLTVANTSTIVAATPTGLTATPFSNHVVLTWDNDRDCNTNVATKIYRSTNGTDFTLRTTINNSTTRSFDDTTAVNGTQYWWYATREYFGSGHVSAASSTVTTQPPNGVPVFTRVAMVPTIVRLSNGATQTFAPVALDQFGAAMASQPSFTYSIDLGGGSFAGAVYTSDGLLAVVRATASGISGVAIVNRKTSLRNRSRSCSRERTS